MSQCSLWVEFENCVVVGSAPEKQCSQVIERMAKQRSSERGAEPLVLEHLILRGRVFTVRKDITYDKSVPKSARVGFGHLGAYPAQIAVEQLVLGAAP